MIYLSWGERGGTAWDWGLQNSMSGAGMLHPAPNAVVSGEKIESVFSSFLVEKNHSYSEGGSFSDLQRGRYETGHFNVIKPLLIRSLETATVFNRVRLMFYIAALPT